MIRDLRSILEGWEYEAGKISVRKIIGRDGREKIQTRIDLGVLQLECAGRPDGQRPRGYESLFEYHESRLREHADVSGSDEDFVLSPEDCRELRHEAYLYYQRYLSLFVLEEYEGVERDTARNLRLVEFCERYAATEADRGALRRQRAYVLMMHTRARAYQGLAAGRCEQALRIVDDGLAGVEALSGDETEETPHASELKTLQTLRREILEKLPDNAPAKLLVELECAVQVEDYERAAELRDLLGQRPQTAESQRAQR
jgi:hypothetical protein